LDTTQFANNDSGSIRDKLDKMLSV
jgi:hypothetical protein